VGEGAAKLGELTPSLRSEKPLELRRPFKHCAIIHAATRWNPGVVGCSDSHASESDAVGSDNIPGRYRSFCFVEETATYQAPPSPVLND